MFVINLVDEALGAQMNQCAVDFPPDVSEIDAARLNLKPSEKVKVPRIAEAPAALECRHFTTLEVSAQRRLAIGEIVYVHVRGGLWDPDKMRIDMTQYRPLARLFGNFYASLGEPFATCGRAMRNGRSGRGQACGPRTALHRPDRHRDRRLRRVDHRNAERILQRRAMPRHAGAAHHDRVRAVLILQRAADLDHARQGLVAGAISATDNSSGRSPARRSINPICRR